MHGSSWAGVNPTRIPQGYTIKGVLYEEVGELLLRIADLGGYDGGTCDNICDGNILTPKGKDLINYVYITSK